MGNKLTQNQILERIDEELAKRDFFIDLIDKENYQVFGQNIILQTFQLSQYMIGFFAILEGYECDDNGMVSDPRNQNARPMSLPQLLKQLEDYIPEKYSTLLFGIRTIRNKAAHAISFSYEDYVDYLNALNSFSLWFVTNEDVLEIASEEQRIGFFKRRIALEKRIVFGSEHGKRIYYDSLRLEEKASSHPKEVEISNDKEKKKVSLSSARPNKKVAEMKISKSTSAPRNRAVAKKASKPTSSSEKIVPAKKNSESKKKASIAASKSEKKVACEKAKSVSKQTERPSNELTEKPYREPTGPSASSYMLYNSEAYDTDLKRDPFEKIVKSVLPETENKEINFIEKLLFQCLNNQNEIKKNQHEMKENQHEIKENQNKISNQIDGLSQKIETLGKKLVDYQTLMQRQLDTVSSEEAKEQILSAFTDVLIEKIRSDVLVQYDKKDYNDEKRRLQKSFGDTWEKLQPATQKFLASAKILYKQQCKLDDQTDYSSVCVLITKSLEVEISKRFYKDFMSYLMANCVRDGITNAEKYIDFPTFMLKKKKPLKAKEFTLGSVAYFFCYKRDDRSTDEQWENNKSRLIEYCKSELLSKYNDEEIMQLLQEYAEAIETVRIDYRNPSAHTDMLQEINAKECMDLVVDVEKLLKRMVDSFDK